MMGQPIRGSSCWSSGSLIPALFLMVPMLARAQAPSVSVGTAAGFSGANVDIVVSYSSGDTPVSSLQFELTLPPSAGYVSTVTGAAAVAAGKSVTGNAVPGGVRLLLFGLNQTAIGTGTLATIRFSIAAGTPAGNIAIGIANIMGTTPDAIPVTVDGIGGSIAVSVPADNTPPVITGVSAGSITTSSAVVRWTTNEVADTQVEYGPTTSYGKTTTLASSRVTEHSQTLSGLTLKTTYNYRVKSRDAAGNLAVSGNFTFTTAATADTTAPVISGVRASGITSTSATVAWATNEAADTQVEYGKTAAYGQATAINTAKVTAHSQRLSGLTAGTLYHCRVKSRDAAGNLAVSGDSTFTTSAPDSGAPLITEVKAAPADQSAIITWTTNEIATSQVEWGFSVKYGQQSANTANATTSHWVRLTGLTEETDYHFRVRSTDTSGNAAVSQDFGFKTTRNQPRQAKSLYLPTLSLNYSSAPGSERDEYTGIALANLDTADANIIFTAFDSTGNRLAGSNVSNPVQRMLRPGEQLPVLDSQLFGPDAGMPGWMRVESTIDKVSGFFLAFDSDLTVLDGATASTDLLSASVLPEAGEQNFTQVFLANPNNETVPVTIKLVKADGTVRSYTTREIRADSALKAHLYADLFPSAQPDPSDYLLVTSSRGIVPVEMLGAAGRHVRVLNGQDASRGSTTLYSPQYAVGGPWRSTISVVNLDPRPATVTMRFLPQGTSQPPATRVFNVAANGKIHLADQTVFLDPGVPATDDVTTGYVEISSDGARLSGSVTFGDAQGESFASALPLVGELRSSIVFSHVASNETYFTGLALLNPDLNAAVATIDLYRADGNREASTVQIVPGKTRLSRVLTELFPDLVGQDRTSGYLRITSNVPLACFALFGTNSLSVLSAIPAQPAP